MGSFLYNHLRTSGEIAKLRTELAVSGDRIDCNPELLFQLRLEIRDILAKYFYTDDEDLEIRVIFQYRKEQEISDVKTIQIK